jgi:hypothetical protein
MQSNSKRIIHRIGETDQLFLQKNTPDLALERAELRLELVTMSSLRQEQIHFLQEAIVILECGRIDFEEIQMRLYINLSLLLAKAYMMYFEITQDEKFAIICQQVLKPLASSNHADIFFFMAYASVSRKEFALTRHWLGKYFKTQDYDLDLVRQHSAFAKLHQLDWFIELTKSKMS